MNPSPHDLDALVQPTHEAVRLYLAGMGVPLDLVDDLAQETYLAFISRTEPIPDGVDQLGWLKGIARNIANNHFRTQGRRAGHLMRIADLMERTAALRAAVDEDADQRERRLIALASCMDKLPPQQRELLHRHYHGGELLVDMAAALHRSEIGLRVTFHRLRQALRHCVDTRLGSSND